MGMALATLPLALDNGRVIELLDLWARSFHDGGQLRKLWYPDGAAGCVGGGYSMTFEDMWDAKEQREIEGVDGAVESLEPIQQCAVFHVHLYSVYRFRRPVDDIYFEALDALALDLPKRGVY
jgi:hypothetical protein